MIERVTIIIPTCNRVRTLKALLDSLETMNRPDAIAVEVAVVNNASTDGTAELLANESARRRRYPVTVLNESRQGKAHALNYGLTKGKGDLFLILDDDVSVDPRCLTAHLDIYGKHSFAAVQGKVLPGNDETGRGAELEQLRQYNIPVLDHGSHVVEIRGFIGTNISFLRSVRDKVGLFDVRLGPGASGFSEDTEYSRRVRQAGFKIGYTPHAVVYHELNMSRYGRGYARAVQYRKGVSRSLYRKDSVLFNVLPKLVGQCFRYAAYRLIGRVDKAYKAEGSIMKSWGHLAGKVRKLRGQLRRPPVV